MTDEKRKHADDLRAASKLLVHATREVTAVVEDMHRTIASGPGVLGKPLAFPARLLTRLVYAPILGITSLVGKGVDALLTQLAPWLGESAPGPERDAVLAVLNGVLGDYLAESGNPLAIEMQLRAEGKSLPFEKNRLSEVLPNANGKLLVMVHGSSMNDRQWNRDGHDHGAALARDLGFTTIYLRYNSGLHVSTNGRAFAERLESLVAAWPVPIDEITIIGHSMGGLVARSACHVAESEGLAWRRKLHALVCIGTPHHGAPLERGGNLLHSLLDVSSYSAPIARLAKIRSAGVTDLRFGNVLDEHWEGRARFALSADVRHELSLPEGVACFAIAGTTATSMAENLAGDGLVLVKSALGQHEKKELTLDFPEKQQWIALGVGHLDLLSSPLVYAKLREWLATGDRYL